MTWEEIFNQERQKEYFKNLQLFLDQEYQNKNIFPPKNKIFNAFDLTPFEQIKVVILGQDPYHGKDQAQGLAFSTPEHIKNPPSMVNILKEIKQEFDCESSCSNGDLTPWAKSGVLLINTILTVEESKPKSHSKKGWEIFTDTIIKTISDYKQNVIFLLWGNPSISKAKLIDKSKHFILTAPHPSPLSAFRGFFGSDCFKQTNEILKTLNKDTIKW
jgi:uracil-DNA glycosylase